ncbi:MAG: HAMP domain-containing histidine kinase, partial [Candidatus Nitrosopelagicus sp.]|nr:HAMP domain-containing histidine kinase [Candidatus Nitrosopelagicus sp.]
DRSGQQQTALVQKNILPAENLSSKKAGAAFFDPSFEKNDGESYVQYPYVSPATERWVFAYTTPILTYNDKPAFYHFEMPMYVFQNLISTDVGRMYVVDSGDYLVADNHSTFNSEVGAGKKGQDPSEYFPSVTTVSDSDKFLKILDEMNGLDIGEISYSTYIENGEKHFVVFEKLPTFYWILAYDVPYSQLLYGETTLGNLKATLLVISLIVGAGGIGAVFVVSNRISRPITLLADSCKQQDANKLERIDLKTDDEINDVANALNTMIKKVNEVGKMKEEFSSMVTHELKTPLTPILGWCQTLMNPKIMGELTDKQKNAIEKIQSNAERLRQLVGDILDAEKLDMEKMKFDYVEINITEFFTHLEDNLQDTMKAKELEFNVSSDADLVIISDKNRLEQVLSNIILNAVDFVNQKGRIDVSVKDSGNTVEFSVKDNGIGIPRSKINGLFKKFYQVDTSMTREHGGTGLGLAIVKGIVNGLGGKVWVKSKVKVGTTFYFTIPKKQKKSKK